MARYPDNIEHERWEQIDSLVKSHNDQNRNHYEFYVYLPIELFKWTDKIDTLTVKEINLPTNYSNDHIGSNHILIVGHQKVVEFQPTTNGEYLSCDPDVKTTVKIFGQKNP